MRRWHRWLSVLFGLLILFVAVTGVMSHFAAIVAEGERPAQAAAPAGLVCPDTMPCRPKPVPGGARSRVGYLHHLHSGEEFDPIGTALAIASGLALIFLRPQRLVDVRPDVPGPYEQGWGKRRQAILVAYCSEPI